MFFTARIERPPLYRGGSASKKNGLPAPLHPSEAARCASTGIVPATPTRFFSILREEAVLLEIILVNDGSRFRGKLSPFLQQAFDIFPDQI